MWVPITFFLLSTLFFSAAAIDKFIRLRSQPVYLSVILVLSLFLPFSIIFLLPIDLISTSNDTSSSFRDSIFYLSQPTVLLLWRFNYWTTFLLTWIVLPFLQYWFASGYYNRADRLKYASIQLIKFQMIMIACGIVALIYILIQHPGWLNFTFLKSLVITISHIYSLVLALWLMAHGLIHLPRTQWETSGNYEYRLHKMYLKIPELKEKLEDTRFELKELCGRVKTLVQLDNLEFRDWILKLQHSIPEEFQTLTYHGVENFTSQDLNKKTLNKVSKKLKDLKWRYNHNQVAFKLAVDQVILLEDKVNASLLGELNTRLARPLIRNPRFNYILSQYVQPSLGKSLAIILVLLSIIVIESETFHGIQISLLKLIIKGLTINFRQIYLQIFAISFVVLTYMLLCAMLSLSQVKIFNIYHIESNQSSDPVSAIFFISYACRLTIPLSYNFLMLLDSNFTKNSSFQLFFGDSIQLIALGNFLNDILPRLIMIPILLSFFRIWERLRDWLSNVFLFDYILTELDFDSESNMIEDDMEGGAFDNRLNRENARIHEAKLIIQRQLNTEDRFSGGTAAPIRPFTLSSSGARSNDMVVPDRSLPRTPLIAGLRSFTGKVFSLFSRRDQSQRQGNYNGLRSYNLSLSSGDTLSRRTSSETGISLNTNPSFDNDNRLLRDDDIMLIEDDDEEEFGTRDVL